MIYVNGKPITAIYYGAKTVTAIYYGARLVWQAISSCFGSGVWLRDKLWIKDETWINN